MATLTAVSQDLASCADADGGIVQSYFTDFANITSMTFAATREVTAIVMAAPGTNQWVRFIYDDDDTAFYNQTGVRDGKKHNYDQQAFMQFEGITIAKVDAFEDFKECCNLVGLHVFNSGIIMMQGAEDDGTGAIKRTKVSAKGTINIFSDTGDNVERIEVTVDSQSKRAHVVDLTTAAIEAL